MKHRASSPTKSSTYASSDRVLNVYIHIDGEEPGVDTSKADHSSRAWTHQ